MTRNQILYYDAREKNRSNLANERLTQLRDTETARANLARETETHRSNVAQETETARANLARETETNRTNVARETETNRSNLANELLRAKELDESIRSNQARETHNTAVLAETTRSNLAKELQAQRELSEATRAHRANELLTQASVAEQVRSNLARELETNRHNVESESLTQRSQDFEFINTQRGQDMNAANVAAQNQNRIDTANIANAGNLAVQELRERGMDARQAKQIVSDALNVLHDDIASLLSDRDAFNQIRRLILDWSWDHRDR